MGTHCITVTLPEAGQHSCCLMKQSWNWTNAVCPHQGLPLDWLLSWNPNLRNYKYIHRGEFVCVRAAHWWHAQHECHSGLGLWDEVCAPNRAPWISGQCIQNRTQMIWVRGQKASHYSKLKLKALHKPKWNLSFSRQHKVNIQETALLTCNLQCQPAFFPSLTSSLTGMSVLSCLYDTEYGSSFSVLLFI